MNSVSTAAKESLIIMNLSKCVNNNDTATMTAKDNAVTVSFMYRSPNKGKDLIKDYEL